MKAKCRYCDNDVEIRGYRSNNGVVGSELVCLECYDLEDPPLKIITS